MNPGPHHHPRLRRARPSAWHQDIALAPLAATRAPLHYHVPSLVEHIGVQSTWSGPQHRAMDFDPEWRRPALVLPRHGSSSSMIGK